MGESSEQQSRRADARDDRRWLISVLISVVFGLFGVVMALLSYSHRSSTSPAASPAPPGRLPATRPGERAHEGPRQRR